ncbi:hypothetical protein [Blastococcus deserti]|uniref:Ribosomally synthesized peptide with SipW-like signal peptide n=1 Tax=Blastococcus deserti TaxID=2259033 RepID=A0ABW4XFM1_9ACTN
MKLSKRASVIALFLVAVVAGGVASAAWLVSGTGTASSQAASAVSLTVTAGTPTASLYPKPAAGYGSGTVGAVQAKVDNPNPFPVQLTSATIGAVSITPLSGRTCAASNVVGLGTIALATPVLLPASSTGTVVTVPGALEMISTAENGCQGAGITAQVTLSGASA